MQSRTLFSADEQLSPDRNRAEPALWLRRVVILRGRNDRPAIRDIPFRRGLNIIQTRQRAPNEQRVVGHSVGKTLLMRLIRYTLGEHGFARRDDQQKIVAQFPDGVVIAHWRVQQRDWIIVRPLADSRHSQSVSIKSDDWESTVDDVQQHLPFDDFLNAVGEAVFVGLPNFLLPRARRSPKWLDVLGWLARDNECGYRAANDWRHKTAESGSALDLDDNSIVLQWIAGLMGLEEIELKQRHMALLRRLQKAKRSRESAQKIVDVTGPKLYANLEIEVADNEESDVINAPDSLFSERVIKRADEKIDLLEGLILDRRHTSKLVTFETEEEETQEAFLSADAELRATTSQIEHAEKLITAIKRSAIRSVYAAHSPFEDCPYGKCPLRLDNRPIPTPDPARDDRLDILQQDLSELQESILEKTRLRDKAQTAYVRSKRASRNERDRLSLEITGIERRIGEWETYRRDAVAYCQAMNLLDDSTRRQARLDAQIDKSNRAQDKIRRGLSRLRNRHSRCYQEILAKIFGEHAKGEISVDGKGLRPKPSERLSPNGTAMTVMTLVLAFDLANVAASILGIGHHPRFLMHDSPREGDMEEPLFHRLFELATELEQQFGKNVAPFQYIVTTTTRPPAELADEKGPYAVLTLDAKTDDGRLLKVSF